MPGRSWVGWVVPPLAGLRIVLLRVNPRGWGSLSAVIIEIQRLQTRESLGSFRPRSVEDWDQWSAAASPILGSMARADAVHAPRRVRNGRHHPEWDPGLSANIDHPRHSGVSSGAVSGPRRRARSRSS